MPKTAARSDRGTTGQRPEDPDLAEIERLARLLDTRYRIPIIGYPIGLDGILGLIPGIGDVAALMPAAYIIWRARKLGAPPVLIAQMAANTGADTLIGTVPILGQIFDIVFKSNNRNVELLRRHLENQRLRDVTPPS